MTCSYSSDVRSITVKPHSSNKCPERLLEGRFKEGGFYKSFGFFDFTCVQNKHKKPYHGGVCKE